MFFDDAPADILFNPDAGVPASGVPQYWQRAAGFDDKLIAHAESKHLVKFMREHGAAHVIEGKASKPAIKNANFLIIFSLWGYYIKKTIDKKVKK